MSDADPLRDQLVALLQTENEVLRERVRQLESKLTVQCDMPLEFALTAHEHKILKMMVKRPGMVVTKEQFLTELYWDRAGADEPAIKIIDVFLCKIRKKLAPFGISIETVWGRGYYVTVAAAEAVLAMTGDGAPADSGEDSRPGLAISTATR